MKKILALLLAMLMVLSLCACGAKEETTTEAPAEAPAAEAAAAEAPVAPPEGEASGEPSGEPPADVPVAAAQTNEAHGGTAGATSEDDYKAYLKAWLDYEQSVNSTMADEMKAEFVAAIDAGTLDVFPADMLFNGMLVTGAAMTYDEFVAANGVY